LFGAGGQFNDFGDMQRVDGSTDAARGDPVWRSDRAPFLSGIAPDQWAGMSDEQKYQTWASYQQSEWAPAGPFAQNLDSALERLQLHGEQGLSGTDGAYSVNCWWEPARIFQGNSEPARLALRPWLAFGSRVRTAVHCGSEENCSGSALSASDASSDRDRDRDRDNEHARNFSVPDTTPIVAGSGSSARYTSY
jgi:hypothetical protein